jgi:hypothetical protein
MRYIADTMHFAENTSAPQPDIEIDDVSAAPIIAVPIGVGLFAIGVLFGFEELDFGETKEQAAEALGVEHLL